jgi:hypothetical protein
MIPAIQCKMSLRGPKSMRNLNDESSRVLCYDRRSIDQFVLEKSTHLGLMSRFLLLSDDCGFVDVGCFLWREDKSVVYNCCWLSPAQSFSGLSPMGLVTIFYCLRFETSLFVPNCDSQGIRSRVHTGFNGSWAGPRYIASARTKQKTSFQQFCCWVTSLSTRTLQKTPFLLRVNRYADELFTVP